jgi:hypothetical protein
MTKTTISSSISNAAVRKVAQSFSNGHYSSALQATIGCVKDFSLPSRYPGLGKLEACLFVKRGAENSNDLLECRRGHKRLGGGGYEFEVRALVATVMHRGCGDIRAPVESEESGEGSLS